MYIFRLQGTILPALRGLHSKTLFLVCGSFVVNNLPVNYSVATSLGTHSCSFVTFMMHGRFLYYLELVHDFALDFLKFLHDKLE